MNAGSCCQLASLKGRWRQSRREPQCRWQEDGQGSGCWKKVNQEQKRSLGKSVWWYSFVQRCIWLSSSEMKGVEGKKKAIQVLEVELLCSVVFIYCNQRVIVPDGNIRMTYYESGVCLQLVWFSSHIKASAQDHHVRGLGGFVHHEHLLRALVGTKISPAYASASLLSRVGMHR